MHSLSFDKCIYISSLSEMELQASFVTPRLNPSLIWIKSYFLDCDHIGCIGWYNNNNNNNNNNDNNNDNNNTPHSLTYFVYILH